MKPFNLKEYLANPSRKVVTRDGRPVRILCTDAKGYCPVFALATHNGIEIPLMCSEIGEGDFEKDDLFFSTETKVGWINIYKIPDTNELEASIIFETKEKAESYHRDNLNYVATTKITWEE